MSSTDEFLQLSRELGRSDFAARWDHLFLVFGNVQAESGSFDFEFETRVEFQTLRKVTGSAVRESQAGGVLPIIKSNRNPYSDRISVGRAKTCDIILPTRYASKLHAHFLQSSDGSWDIRDADSANGTYRNGVKLIPGQRVAIKVNDTLRFAFLDTRLVDAGALYDWLKAHPVAAPAAPANPRLATMPPLGGNGHGSDDNS